jgi:response regulator RpfG family c-di-GMP phosphodiesterase
VLKSLDVLVVDDEVEDACTVARVLRQRHRVRIAIGLRDAIHEVAKRVPDVIIAAFEMPPYRGDALLAMVAREHPGVRRILFKHARRGRAVMAAPLATDAAHTVLHDPLEPSLLLAALGDAESAAD